MNENEIINIPLETDSEHNYLFEITPLSYYYRDNGNPLVFDVPHRITFYAILYVTAGSGFHYTDFEKISYQPGDLLLAAPNQIICFDLNSELEGYTIIFNPEFLLQSSDDLNLFHSLKLFNALPGSPKISVTQSEQQPIQNLLEMMLAEYMEPNQKFGHRDLLVYLLKSLLIKAERLLQVEFYNRAIESDYTKLVQFRDLLEANYQNQNKVDFYIQKLAISAKILNKLTNQYLHKSVKQMIIDRTILEIKRLLTNSSLTAKEIAYQTGFEDPANMQNYFKKSTGLTPLEFRNQHILR